MAKEKLLLLLLLLVLLFMTKGCTQNHYRVEMRPENGGVRRTITCWRADSNGRLVEFPPEELRHIENLYPAGKANLLGNEHQFTGNFTPQTPQDVGGSGDFTHITTPMGEVFSYNERFRGSTDIEKQFELRRKCVNLCLDLLIGWFESEIGDDPNFPSLRKYIDQTLRHDCINLIHLFAKQADILTYLAGGNSKNAEIKIQFVRFLRECNYLSDKDIQSISLEEGPDSIQALSIARRHVLTQLKLNDQPELPKSLLFLKDQNSITLSFKKYYYHSPIAQKIFAAQWKSLIDIAEQVLTDSGDFNSRSQLNKKENLIQGRDDSNPRLEFNALPSEDAYVWIVGAAIGAQLFETPELLVQFDCDTAPHYTNGEWNAAEKRVYWKNTIIGRHPIVNYAVWSVPNSAFQTERFGKVVLAGKELSNYSYWHAQLSTEERNQWDSELALLSPASAHANLTQNLKLIRINPETKLQEDNASKSRAALLEGLEGLKPPLTLLKFINSPKNSP